MEYLEKLRDFGVVNIEMECTIFGALTHYAGIRAGIVCVTLLDRLKGDQVYEFISIILAIPSQFNPFLHHLGNVTQRGNE